MLSEVIALKNNHYYYYYILVVVVLQLPQTPVGDLRGTRAVYRWRTSWPPVGASVLLVVAMVGWVRAGIKVVDGMTAIQGHLLHVGRCRSSS